MLSTRTAALACALVIAAAGVARAERVVALAPLTALDDDASAPIRKVTAALERAIASLPDTKVVSAAQVAAAIRKSRKPQLRVCEGDARCLADVGQLVGAGQVIAGQIGGLADAQIVYLSVTDVATGKELRSTTLAIDPAPGAGATTDAPTAAVVRLLDPARHRGVLRFAIDVRGATVYVNGSKVTPSARGEVALAVGTHAVRVTHPQYRDFVRFIDVPFGKTVEVPVAMAQFPVVERDVAGNPVSRDRVVYVDPPVWRRWYVIAPAAVGVAIVAGVIAAALAHDLPSGPCRKIGGEQC